MTPVDLLKSLSGPSAFAGAPFGADVITFCDALMKRGGIGVYVARDDRMAQAARRMAVFAAPRLEQADLPGWDMLPYDRISPTPAVAARRCAGLARIARYEASQGPLLVVTTAGSLVQRVPPIATLRKASFAIKRGQSVKAAELTEYLAFNGYVRSSTVREQGEFAIRGGIIDIFPPTALEPYRLDFFGDTVETLRTFDTETQRSTGSAEGVTFAPVSEILFDDNVLSKFRDRFLETFGPPSGDQMYEAARASIRRQGVEAWLPLFHGALDTLFDYTGPAALWGLGHLASEAAHERLTQANDYYAARLDAGGGDIRIAKVLPPERLYLTLDELDARLSDRAVVRFSPNDPMSGAFDMGGRRGRDFAPERLRTDENIFETVIAQARALYASGKPVVFAAWSTGSADRLINVLGDHGLTGLAQVHTLDAARKTDFAVAEVPIEAGFSLPGFAMISEADVLGDRLAAPRRKRKSASFITDATALTAGDLVVHVDHGVGRYAGLRTLELTGAPHDCLQLEYAGGDMIFLPVENIDLISRYGSEESESQLDRLGGAGWQTRKAKAKKRILEMAAELMQIAAARELRRADAVSAGQGLYEEFAARFPYEETEDQLSAIEDVLGDLASGKPMDRLVCGDVGFGKTEVALRAAFVAAMSGKQVAVIAPTTLLARQHYKTFEDRFAGWPLKVRPLSRFVSARDAAETRAALADGSVDVVVGTHALLTKEIEFKRLGLMVVDEEQRFGVKHKERLKELKSDVHVLTLSATPIPRTLQMALTGIRDLSIIATPPVDRLSVRTYITEEDTVTLREALLREKYRGGQAFFVAPRIQDLDKLEDFLRVHVPEVSFIVAHGQMAAGELEDIMTAFYEGKYDVLLSTTIVESGLDIPRANTLIIHRADMFGLAQLYQLRGRVGRSKLRAYAYFTTPRDKVITETAEKRLKVLQSLDSLGAGFQLASHDLDMRGAGNLLGDQQSGQVKEVGVELYQSMLEDAVKALKAGAKDEEDVADDWSPQINLGVAVLIPDGYVEDLNVRLSLYRRLSDITTAQDREAFAAELIDRFGPLPDETRQLLDVMAIKVQCRTLGIAKMDAGEKGAVFAFRPDTIMDPARLMEIVRSRPNQLKLRPDSKLVHSGLGGAPDRRIPLVKAFLKELEAACGLASAEAADAVARMAQKRPEAKEDKWGKKLSSGFLTED
ncbi:MAG: transcription-repair coupling factor [Hyphomonas sp.]|uniref:transcription-repair coupling factor n=1 Tax=Hyphomonas sp. TaxID=87 RepID=UPI0017BFDD9A|nr:transcription-repair coupling factor [Hyphomonas sp.]MBA3067214.1 transcription-repair coupling factor [Hyphomonas sp.]MBU3922600.1 transcription-repair coupling factor [Alphaproteobacteria bacterium]MBU4061176.1 transcription-repair coupling factor [Alphaproteobacteria bacterium]MBU4165088.1 transcription-repair coupling factor [Alphaproteobacteria bacterium]